MIRPSLRLAWLAPAVALAACATTPRAAVGPADIPSLERAVAASPQSADTLTLLGAAYATADRHADAVRTLERAVATGAAPALAHLYLGASLESLERWQDAREAYVTYLASDESHGLRRDVERRLAVVDRELLDVQARAMLEQEAALSQAPAAPRSVAVLPFTVRTDDPRFAPLQLALADMVTTDLAVPGVLVMLERTQIQALVREMALTLGGFADPESGARVGRLMRAEHVVQGSVTLLPDERVRMELSLLEAARRERTGSAADEAALDAIFEAEKTLVLQMLELLGVTLTASEREAIEENRSSSLLAFLAYGEGLMAAQEGDYAAAAAAFGRALDIDPGFQAAETRAREAGDILQALPPGEIAAAAMAGLTGDEGPDPRDVALTNVTDLTNPNPGAPYTGTGSDRDGSTFGFDDPDTRNDPDEGRIGTPTVRVPINIPNPTQP